MKELLNSILETSKERLKNPVVGSFLISWIIFNWKPILYFIFSKSSVEIKIVEITNKYSNIYTILFFPILTCLLYVIVFPYILMLIDKIISKAIKTRKNEIHVFNIFDIKNKQKLAEEESELENIKASYRDKKDLNKKIEILNTQIDIKDKTIESLNHEILLLKRDSNFSYELDSELIKDLNEEFERFKNSTEFEFFEEIGKNVALKREFPTTIDSLVREKYKILEIISEKNDGSSQRVFVDMTNKGQYFWKQYLLGIQIKKEK